MKSNICLLLLSAILFCNPAPGQAPSIQWEKFLGGSGRDFATSIQQTTDGGYIVAGRSESVDGDVRGNHGSFDFWVVKLTSEGDTLWTKTLGGSSDESANAVQQTADGGYIVAGYSFSNNGDLRGNLGGSDCWVVKLKSNGDTLWTRSFGGSGWDQANSIHQTEDGGYIVAGQSASDDYDVSNNYGLYDYWVVKLKPNGDIEWERSLGGSQSDMAYAVQQTADGGYIVAGSSASNNHLVSGNNGGTSDFWVVKLDDEGTIQWQRCLGSTLAETARSVQQTDDGGYIVAGYAGEGGWPEHSADYWVVKLEPDGDTEWTKSFGGGWREDARSIQQTTDGGYIVVGESNGDMSDNHGNFDYWVVKLKSDGDTLWTKSLGGGNHDYAYAVQQTTDGGYIVAGYSASGDAGDGYHGNYDFWIVKLGPDDPLPVKLVSFTVETLENAALLQWKTVDELHNKGFEIEHSADALEWKQIGFHASRVESGSSSLTLPYIHTHTNPLPGQNYYRLKQIDLDGKYEYSPIRTITFKRQIAINVYPNPVAEAVTITGLKGGETISITDALGRVLKEHKSEDQHTSLSLGGLGDGIYHLHIMPVGREAKMFKVVKTGSANIK